MQLSGGQQIQAPYPLDEVSEYLLACHRFTFSFFLDNPGALSLMESTQLVAYLVIWHDILLTVLSLITLVFLGLFIHEMRQGHAPTIDSNWGGIGGGGGGWRMSSSLAYLLGMFGMATLLVIVLVRVEDPRPKNSNTSPPDNKPVTASASLAAAGAPATPTLAPPPNAVPTGTPALKPPSSP
jgi:hypothetical protein